MGFIKKNILQDNPPENSKNFEKSKNSGLLKKKVHKFAFFSDVFFMPNFFFPCFWLNCGELSYRKL